MLLGHDRTIYVIRNQTLTDRCYARSPIGVTRLALWYGAPRYALCRYPRARVNNVRENSTGQRAGLGPLLQSTMTSITNYDYTRGMTQLILPLEMGMLEHAYVEGRECRQSFSLKSREKTLATLFSKLTLGDLITLSLTSSNAKEHNFTILSPFYKR